jgi:carotenoid cleavage dioxygenase-like enzyme
MQVVARSSHVLPRAGLALHDAVATPNHLVAQCFASVSVGTLLWGAKPAIDALDYDRSRSLPLLAIPRGEGGEVRVLEVPAGHHGFHLFNAFEADGRLVVDAVLYAGRVDFRPFYPPGFPDVPPTGPLEGPFPTRFVHDLGTGRTEVRRIEGVRGEAPEVDPRRHGRPTRFGYAATPGARGDEPIDSGYFWFHGVAKIDFEGQEHAVYSFPERVYCSPPAFAARGEAEDDGWLVVWLLDAAERRGGLAVLDARDPSRGPVAVRWMRARLPPVSHASFLPAGGIA